MEKEIRLLTNSDKGIVLDYLERNHLECTFLIGNVVEFGLENDKTIRRGADYYGYFEDESLRGIAPFYNLGSCIPHFESLNAIPFLINVMEKKKFEYLLGMENIIAPIYKQLKEFKITEDFSDDSYFINEDFKPFVLEGIEIKDQKSVKFEDVVDFLMEARKKGFDDETTEENVKKMFTEGTEEEDRVFILKDGKFVAHGVIQTATSKINQIGGVYTSEEHRGKGYCKALISELCRRIVERGKIPTLMVRKDNSPAVKAYNSVGFKYYTDYIIIKFK